MGISCAPLRLHHPTALPPFCFAHFASTKTSTHMVRSCLCQFPPSSAACPAGNGKILFRWISWIRHSMMPVRSIHKTKWEGCILGVVCACCVPSQTRKPFSPLKAETQYPTPFLHKSTSFRNCDCCHQFRWAAGVSYRKTLSSDAQVFHT